MKKNASSFLEYVILLGVISAVFIGMNTYVKRNIQGRVKDMTDNFIGSRQLAEVDLTVSDSNTISRTDINSQLALGGATEQITADEKSVSARSRVENKEVIFQPQFTPADSGTVTPPVREQASSPSN